MSNQTNFARKVILYNESNNLRGEKISTKQFLSKTSDGLVFHDNEKTAFLFTVFLAIFCWNDGNLCTSILAFFFQKLSISIYRFLRDERDMCETVSALKSKKAKNLMASQLSL